MKPIDNLTLFFHGCWDDFSKGQCYECGRYVTKDLNTALVYYRQAMSQGDARAHFRMAELYQEEGKENKSLLAYYGGAIRNHEPCRGALMTAADRGSANATFFVGKVFAKDNNWQMAIKYYQQAASKEHAEAMYCLGQVYQHGVAGSRSVNVDTDLALFWYKRATQFGSKYALDELITMSHSVGKAALYLAEVYEGIEKGLLETTSRALEFYTKASELGESQASFYLGQLYEEGRGEIKPYKVKAYSYYVIAALRNHEAALAKLNQLAASGDTEAEYALGFGYYCQKGNVAEAVLWCVRAEIQGHKLAGDYLAQTKFDAKVCLQIARQYEEDKANPRRNVLKAAEFYSRAVALGDKEVAVKLAQFYQVEHLGIGKSLDKSFDYYIKAAQLGNQEAWAPLERLAEEMSSQRQMELSRLYGSFFNHEKAHEWSARASETSGNIKVLR